MGDYGRRMNIALNGKQLEVECFKYSESKITINGGIATEIGSMM